MAYLTDLIKRKKAEKTSFKQQKPAATPKEERVPLPPKSVLPKSAPPKLDRKTVEKSADKIRAVSGNKAHRTVVESYGNVQIIKVGADPLYHYEVPVPRYRGEERALINALIDIAAGVISISHRDELSQEELRDRYREKLMAIMQTTPELKVPEHARDFYADVVVKEMLGFGLIDSLVEDDLLEEIMIVGPTKPVFVFHRKYGMMSTNVVFYEDRDIRTLIDRIARNVGRRIDVQAPLLDARLPDGTRVNATVPPASIDGSTLTLRKFRKDPMTVVDLINAGTMTLEVAGFLWMASDGLGAKPANILIAGGTASGNHPYCLYGHGRTAG